MNLLWANATNNSTIDIRLSQVSALARCLPLTPLQILSERQRSTLTQLVRIHRLVVVQIQLIIAFCPSASLTFTLILAEVLMMRHQFILIIDTDQGVPSRELLVELFLCGNELPLIVWATSTLLTIWAHLSRRSLQGHSLVKHGRVRLAGHGLQCLVASRFLTIGSQENTSIFHTILSCLIDTDPALTAMWIEILSTVSHVTLMVVLVGHYKATISLTTILLTMHLNLIDKDRKLFDIIDSEDRLL